MAQPIIFRTSRAIAYSTGGDNTEVRVWIQTLLPDVSEDELDEIWNIALDEAQEYVKYPLFTAMVDAGTEDNEEIDLDEMRPTRPPAELGVWYAWVRYKKHENPLPIEYWLSSHNRRR